MIGRSRGAAIVANLNGKHGRDPLIAVHDSMLNGLGQLLDYFGFSKVMGQLYGAVLLSDKPLCLDDLVTRLDISKANVSMNIRTLENLGMVRQVWVKGSNGRRKYYEAETDFWQIITNIIKGREMRDVGRALDVMSENVELLNRTMSTMNAEDQELAAHYIDRISQLRGLFQFAQLIITTVLARVNQGEDGVDEISRIDLN